ncbi:MAG TPA: DEAD/DEAH box helicase [Promineifilum sp.]|nr:DEAD/DEAH box helicase [Promineifilum sp.]HRO22889.1 DEAD/DEAH box helicase [Promineifilum sp.]HRO89114.1 DEAD/DEAH box helicase [Promineifilum sp.]HRQ13988.1 DEAD/DEAH box helicase [Promineifilum sp.]
MKQNFELRTWQKEAFSIWERQMRGVVAAVTGAGKTSFALLCIEKFFRTIPNGVVLVVVPTQALLDQWYLSLVDDAGVQSSDIGVVASGRKDWRGRKYVISVINSARALAHKISEQAPTMLVVDECHRAGSEKNAQIFTGSFSATLGLSATPERQYDDGFKRLIQPNLGDIIYRYGYERAYADGVIAPFKLTNIRFSLTQQEQEEYDMLSRRIAVLLQNTNEDSGERIKLMLLKRSRISWNSPLRVPLAARIALEHQRDRVIVFHESVKQADEIYRILRARNLRTTIYHTGMSPEHRRENLRLYRNGYYTSLICCRALDEGLNVPLTSVGIIASGTSSMRQRIQRLGRVLRQIPGKESAIIYTLYATDSEANRLMHEADKMVEITSVKWLGVNLEFSG